MLQILWPFTIIAKINDVAYKIQLPRDAIVHPVFHVSLLCRVLLPGTEVSTSLPIDAYILAVPVEILQTRWRKSADAMTEQVKVRRSIGNSIDDTWEDKTTLQARFPHVEAWGQAWRKERGMSASLTYMSHQAAQRGTTSARSASPSPTQGPVGPSGTTYLSLRFLLLPYKQLVLDNR